MGRRGARAEDAERLGAVGAKLARELPWRLRAASRGDEDGGDEGLTRGPHASVERSGRARGLSRGERGRVGWAEEKEKWAERVGFRPKAKSEI